MTVKYEVFFMSWYCRCLFKGLRIHYENILQL